jgi:hypothetical protein
VAWNEEGRYGEVHLQWPKRRFPSEGDDWAQTASQQRHFFARKLENYIDMVRGCQRANAVERDRLIFSNDLDDPKGTSLLRVSVANLSSMFCFGAKEGAFVG